MRFILEVELSGDRQQNGERIRKALREVHRDLPMMMGPQWDGKVRAIRERVTKIGEWKVA